MSCHKKTEGGSIMTIQLNMIQTTGLAIVMLLVGKFLRGKLSFSKILQFLHL